MLFFDERFNFLGTSSQWVQVSQAGDGASPLALVNVQAPKNGYAYVYVSNASAQPVYFDNFQAGLVHGPIIEEDHYYAYGLKIASISSNIVPTTYEGYVTNKNLYNDKELVDDGGLNWYDYGYRSYDAQIGRFPQLDPLADAFPVLTPFQYASDEPIANVDMDGLESLGSTGEGIADIGSTVGHWGALIDNATEAPIDIDKIASAVKAASTTGSLAGRLGGIAVKALQVSNTLTKTGVTKYVGAAEVDVETPPATAEPPLSVNQSGQLVETGTEVEEIGEADEFWQILAGIGLKVGGTIGGVLLPLKAGNGRSEGPAPRGRHWGGDMWLRNAFPGEIITNDPSTLSDDYLRGVKERLLKGTNATDNDYRYAYEIVRRELLGYLKQFLRQITMPNLVQHHIFPQKYRPWFASRGLTNIDDYTILIDEKTHQKGVHGKGLGNLPGRWNLLWKQFISTNPNASPSEIFKFAEDLLHRFGLENYKYIPY